jgi:predicted solute-binding protein
MTSPAPVRLGAVSYLNARPLVYGLERDHRFAVEYDLPSVCARRLHAREVDLGLIPSIEYLRGPAPYWFVPGPAVTSRGQVASVAIYTRRDPADIHSIAMDTSSRTSVALATVLLRRVFDVSAAAVPMTPDLEAMLGRADAALIIGDLALFLDHASAGATKIDLGELWTSSTGLPFVYAVWTGWPDALTAEHTAALQAARDEGVRHSDVVARACYPDDPVRCRIAARYLRENIHYYLEDEELEGLRAFYRYAAELGLVAFDGGLRMAPPAF